jgi:hypothetical protein
VLGSENSRDIVDYDNVLVEDDKSVEQATDLLLHR